MIGLFGKKFDFEEYMTSSVEGLRLATEAHSGTWHLGSEKTWNVDQNNGTLKFIFDNNIIATAPAQIIGTYNANDDTFMWAWDHPSVDLSMQIIAKKVKKFGLKNKIVELSTQVVNCSQERAWGYTAIAMRLAKENGGFRAVANPKTFVFMTFGNVVLNKI